VSVRDALELAFESGVRASELARRHLWSCAGCRAHQALLRERPSRLRRLAGWSPWGVLAQLIGGGSVATVQKVAVGTCCALVLGGGAVTVPVVKHHASKEPALAMVTPADVDAPSKPRAARKPHASKPSTPAVDRSTPPSGASTETARIAVPREPVKAKAHRKPRRVISARPARYDDRRLYLRAVQAFMRTNPSAEERQAFFAGAKKFHASPRGSRARQAALTRLAQQAYTRPVRPAPPKGLKPVPTPVATPVATAAPVVETPVSTPVVVETPTAVPTVVATPEPTVVVTPVATPLATATPVVTP